MINPKGILMVEPSKWTSAAPLIDSATRMMTAAWRRRRVSELACRGTHLCRCGVASDNRIHFVGSADMKTNSLCIHYLAFHRDEIPQEELDKVYALGFGEEDPTMEELRLPIALLPETTSLLITMSHPAAIPRNT